jgi:hypothetical protein
MVCLLPYTLWSFYDMFITLHSVQFLCYVYYLTLGAVFMVCLLPYTRCSFYDMFITLHSVQFLWYVYYLTLCAVFMVCLLPYTLCSFYGMFITLHSVQFLWYVYYLTLGAVFMICLLPYTRCSFRHSARFPARINMRLTHVDAMLVPRATRKKVSIFRTLYLTRLFQTSCNQTWRTCTHLALIKRTSSYTEQMEDALLSEEPLDSCRIVRPLYSTPCLWSTGCSVSISSNKYI